MARPHEVHFGWMHHRLFKLKRDAPLLNFRAGETVKVVMVSRMGDCGVTKRLDAEIGYGARFLPFELEPIDPVPETVCKLCHYDFASGDHEKCTPDRKCDTCQGPTGPGDPVCRPCIIGAFLARCEDKMDERDQKKV